MPIFRKQKIANNSETSKANKGYSILEMVIYIALVSIVVLIIFNIIIIVNSNSRNIIALDKIGSEAINSMEIITYQIKNAEYIYSPTSNFVNYNHDPAKTSQLSLATMINVSSPEKIAYLDFYLENGTLFLKEEGANPMAITSSRVSVSDLDFYYYKNDQRESVRIYLTIKPKNNSASSLSINLNNTVTFR